MAVYCLLLCVRSGSFGRFVLKKMSFVYDNYFNIPNRLKLSSMNICIHLDFDINQGNGKRSQLHEKKKYRIMWNYVMIPF